MGEQYRRTGQPVNHAALPSPIHLVIGDGENQMAELPKELQPGDIEIKTLGGAVVGGRGHISVTGRALIGEGSCQILDAERIDAM